MLREPVEPGAVGGAPESSLESWKEIAVYLNRHVTTVRRWEKHEGLPVHRHVHEKLGSVYAFRQEIDDWRRQRRVPLEGPGRDEEGGRGEPPRNGRGTPPSASRGFGTSPACLRPEDRTCFERGIA